MQNVSSISDVLDSALVFCELGDAATFTDEYDAETQSVSFSSGIPAIYASLEENDGKRIDRTIVNAIGRMGSLANIFGCAGGVYGASEGTLEGVGYSLGAVVSMARGLVLRRIISLHGGNNLTPETAFLASSEKIWTTCDGLKHPMEFDAT